MKRAFQKPHFWNEKNPRPSAKRATVQEYQSAPGGCFGCSGVRWVVEPQYMLEGFRKGRIVRLFPDPSWLKADMPFGVGLAAGSHDEEPGDSKEWLPAEFPYRKDFGNEDLPWYQLQPGKFPPDHSEHHVWGELVKIDAAHRSGQCRTDVTGELVNFSLPPFGSILYHNAEAELEDIPLGMRCLFYLHPDATGALTKASIVMDECSYLAGNTLTYRFETSKLDEGKLLVARKVAPVKVDYVLEPRKSSAGSTLRSSRNMVFRAGLKALRATKSPWRSFRAIERISRLSWVLIREGKWSLCVWRTNS